MDDNGAATTAIPARTHDTMLSLFPLQPSVPQRQFPVTTLMRDAISPHAIATTRSFDMVESCHCVTHGNWARSAESALLPAMANNPDPLYTAVCGQVDIYPNTN